MKRNVTFEEISDNKKYTHDDLAKISCNGCLNCHECCDFTDDTIHLDPYDIFFLSKNLNLSFEEMLGKYIDLTVIDSVVTPYLKKDEASKACVFLNSEGRCNIHAFRPGFCRMFPLGRIYEDDGDSFKYFIQGHECPYPNKAKVKIKQWLGINNISKYEEYVLSWHNILKNITECAIDNPDLLNAVNTKLLSLFFVTPYSYEEDFYDQFKERLNTWSK